MRSGVIEPVAKSLSSAIASMPEAAAGALVGQRGVDEAVEQHPGPGLEPGPQALVDELRARGRVEQRLGARVAAQVGVLDEVADALRERHAARLAQQLDGPLARELGVQRRRERRLSGAVDALERDEPSAHGRDATVLAVRHLTTTATHQLR